MVGWMLLLHFNDLMPPVTEGTFWFLMQIEVIVGLLTGYPAAFAATGPWSPPESCLTNTTDLRAAVASSRRQHGRTRRASE